MAQALSIGGFHTDSTTGKSTAKLQLPGGSDPSEITQSVKKAKEIPVEKKKKEVEANTEKLAAISTLKEKGETLKNSAAKLKGPNSGEGISNAFTTKTLGMYSLTAGLNTNDIAVGFITDQSLITEGSINLTIDKVASHDYVKTATFTNPSDTVSADGNLKLNGIDITVTSGMTYDQLASAINAKTSTANVRAEVLKLNDTTYELHITHTDTGKSITFLDSDASIKTALSLPVTETDASTIKAQITLNGSTFIRESNTVTDLKPGMTIAFLQPGDLLIEISEDVASLQNDLTSFIESYNAFVEKLVEFTYLSTETSDAKGILSDRSSITSLKKDFRDIIGQFVGGIDSGKLATLKEAGISWTENGLLYIEDEDLYNTATTEKVSELRKVFEFSASSSNSDFELFGGPRSLDSSLQGKDIIVTYTAEIDGTYTVTFDDGTGAIAGSVDQNHPTDITGLEGTIYEGFSVFFSGTKPSAGNSVTTTLQSVTQGVGNLLSNALSDLLREGDDEYTAKGILQAETDQISQKNTALNDTIERMQESIDRQIETMNRQFEYLGMIQMRMQSVVDYIDAITAELKGR